MNIYLDVNGVLLQQDLTPAIGVTDFLKRVLKNNDVYWLTSHCKGDSAPVLAYLERMLPKEAYELTKQIKPTNWDVLKTDGVDFSKDFLWFDDNLFESERRVLRVHNSEHKHVLVDLKTSPQQIGNFDFSKYPK
jgi:hypothetical protein